MNKQYLSEARLRYLAGTINESEYLSIERATKVKRLKESLNSFTKREFPKALKRLENNLIEHIDTNTFFNVSEQRAIKLFFKHYSVLNEANVNAFSSNILHEGFFDTIKDAGSSLITGIKSAFTKIKTIIGNVGKWLAKIWQSLKDSLIKFGQKGYDKIKSMVGSDKAKKEASDYIENYVKEDEAAHKPQLQKEGGHMGDSVKWGAKGIANWFDSKSSDVASKSPDMDTVEDEASKLKESLFNYESAMFLYEAEINDLPNDILSPNAEAQWKKMGKSALHIIGIILKALAWITNPIYKLAMQVITGSTKLFFNGAAKLIQYVGGPSAIEYLVIPIVIAEGAELKHAFQVIPDLVDQAVTFIEWMAVFDPVVVNIVKTLISLTTVVFSALAYFEILEALLVGAGFIKGH
jgi:hypothetical protein